MLLCGQIHKQTLSLAADMPAPHHGRPQWGTQDSACRFPQFFSDRGHLIRGLRGTDSQLVCELRLTTVVTSQDAGHGWKAQFCRRLPSTSFPAAVLKGAPHCARWKWAALFLVVREKVGGELTGEQLPLDERQSTRHPFL
jgi:hypothetical protein